MISRRLLVALSLLADADAPARATDATTEDYITLADIAVPAERARLLANFLLAGTAATALAFAADLPEGTRDLVAVAASGRVVALELLTWQGKDGSRLQTRLSAVPDHLRLRLERIATMPRGHGYRREQWIDYLAWQGEAPMADAPVRPVLAGTWQASLAAQRAGIRALLGTGPHDLPAALLASCPPPLFPP